MKNDKPEFVQEIDLVWIRKQHEAVYLVEQMKGCVEDLDGNAADFLFV